VTPAADDVTSLSAIGSAAFTTTHWSVVLEAQARTPAAQAALEKLCRTYWRPIFSFVWRRGYSMEDAQDLTQDFFVKILEPPLGWSHEQVHRGY
jgi:RNA polymerase sigma-70 factor (ECF subfamily)